MVLVDGALTEAGAWQRTGRTVLAELADAVHRRPADSGQLIGLGRLGEQPAPAADGTPVPVAVLRAGHPGADGPGELTLPAGECADGAVAAFLASFAASLPAPAGPRPTTAYGRARVLSRSGPDGVRVLGAFNPSDDADRVTGSGTDTGGWTLDLPAGSAAVLVTRDGALVGRLATPEEPSTTPVALLWGGEQADATRVRAS